MRSRRLPLLIALLGLGLAVPHARADEVILIDGRIRTGKVVSEDKRYVVLETQLGRIRIARADVRDVIHDGDPVSDEPAKTDEKSDTARPNRPRKIDRPVKADPPETKDDDPPADGAGDQPEADDPVADAAAAADAAARTRSRRRSRIVRRTSAVPDAPADPVVPRTDEPEGADASQAQSLTSLAPGTELIIFEAPRAVPGLDSAIELGARTSAVLEMAGVRTAWLVVTRGDKEERVGVRLTDIKRHVTVNDPLDRKRMFDGIENDDWLRLHMHDGTVRQGRFEGASSDRVFLTVVNDDGSTDQAPIYVRSIRKVDGLLKSTDVTLALRTLLDDEPIAITMWPEKKQVVGRYVKESMERTLGLDTDLDGKVDVRVARKAAIAEIRRVKLNFRETAIEMRIGDVVKVRHAETFEDAIVRRSNVARVAAVTAYSLALHTDTGAEVLPWKSLHMLVPIHDNPDTAISNARLRLDPAEIQTSVTVLPGAEPAAAASLDASTGVSAVHDGTTVTHVFFTSAYTGDVFGVHVGEFADEEIDQSPLAFNTVVAPRRRSNEDRRPNELHSETLNGMHVTLLVGRHGRISGIELSAATDSPK